MEKILIIEDDHDIAALERDYLEINGYEVSIETDGIKGQEEALSNAYDFIIVDVMLPGKSGFEIVKEIREHLDVPVMIISARTDDIDKIRGLGLGADDYMMKPFSPSELVARVKMLLARYERLLGKKAPSDQIIFRGLKVNPQARKVFLNGEEVAFTTKEFDLLHFFVTNPNIVFSKERLFDRIWGEDEFGDIATVAVHIQKIRKKIEKDPSSPEYIETLWGSGYRFNG